MARRYVPKIKADKKHFKAAFVKTKKINRSGAMTTGGLRF